MRDQMVKYICIKTEVGMIKSRAVSMKEAGEVLTVSQKDDMHLQISNPLSSRLRFYSECISTMFFCKAITKFPQ